MSPTFALVGAAGFVAPRHMDAIHAVDGKLVAAVDPHDSVGVLDRYDRDVEFFTEQARFERWISRKPPDFLVVCAPNHLHETYIRLGLQAGCNVICEKPLVLNPVNLDRLAKLEQDTGKRVYTVLQLRFAVEQLRKQLWEFYGHAMNVVRVRYSTPRGPWYQRSWKADDEKSGGLVTNIGIHMFDALIYLFGGGTGRCVGGPGAGGQMRGVLHLARAEVDWFLSVDPGVAPERTFKVNADPPVDLDAGFTAAHTRVYQEILAGHGWGIEDARPAIELCWALRCLDYRR